MPAFIMRSSFLRSVDILRGTGVSTNKSKYLSDLLLKWEQGVTAPAAPTSLYLALLTTIPTKNDGTGLVEVSGTGYTRVLITPAMWAAISTNSDNVTEQSATNIQMAFPTSGGAWGIVAGVAVYDALTGGNMLRYGTLAGGNITIADGYIMTIASGNLMRTEA